MTDAPDLARGWTAWIDTLSEAGYPARAMIRRPADAATVERAETESGIRFPDELRALYAIADGQHPSFPRGDGPHPPTTPLFPGYDLLTVADALLQWNGWADIHGQHGPDMSDFDDAIAVRGDDPVRGVYWDLGWWPLAMDGGGNFLAVDTAPAPGGTVGQIVVAGPDEDERRRLATGIGDYLRLLVAAGVPAPQFPHPDDPAGTGLDAVYWWDVPSLR